MLSYTVDPGDRIVAIDGAWDEFAARNGAPGLTRESVTGRPLFDYVAGREPRRSFAPCSHAPARAEESPWASAATR